MKFITGNDVCINKYLTINLRITAGLAEPGWTRHGSTLKPLAVCAEAAGANSFFLSCSDNVMHHTL